MRKLIFFSLTFLSIACNLRAQQFKKLNARADSFIMENMKNLDIPGMAVGVVYKGKIIKMSAYGTANLEWKTPVSVHTNFQIASVSKLLATTVIMKSIYEKKLNFEDLVEKYIDSIPASWRGMQIKHLLNHSSGIKFYKGDPSASLEQVVHALKDSTVAFPYGTNQSYVSGDFIMAQYILEKVYHQTYPESVKQVVAVPAGMTDGGFDMAKRVSGWYETVQIPQRSPTYYGPRGNKIPYVSYYGWYAYAAGGYFASLSDMVNWAVALDKEVYFPRQVELDMAYPRDSIGGKLSGFSKVGWGSGDYKNIIFGGHSGGPAFGDLVRFPNEGYTIIVLCNDGEVLPYFANALSTFYIKGLPFTLKMQKFKRTKSLQ